MERRKGRGGRRVLVLRNLESKMMKKKYLDAFLVLTLGFCSWFFLVFSVGADCFCECFVVSYSYNPM